MPSFYLTSPDHLLMFMFRFVPGKSRGISIPDSGKRLTSWHKARALTFSKVSQLDGMEHQGRVKQVRAQGNVLGVKG